MKKEEELTTNDLAEKVDGLASTIGTLANRMDAGFAEIRKEMAGGFVKVENDNNDFAIAVAKGFDEVNEKFDGVDSRFNNIDNQIKTLNSKFDLHDGEFKILRSQMGKGFRELQKEYEDIKSRLERIEKNSDEEMVLLGDDVYHLKSRVLKLEQKIAKLKLAS